MTRQITPSQLTESEFKTYLQNELSRRCRQNTRYSLRSFARTLSIDASSVSQILCGKRRPSALMMEKICAKIGWPEVRPEVRPERHSDDRAKVNSGGGSYFLIGQDCFAAIADWFHYAILDLTLLKSFKKDPAWIARRLGISQTEAKLAVARLLRLEMLEEKGGRLIKTQHHFVNYVPGQSSAGHKEYQRQILRKALEAIDDCAPADKDITAITIVADSKKLEEAKVKIKRFRRELCAFLESGEGDSVHVLAVQLFPLTKNG